jgi:hypothetical protein
MNAKWSSCGSSLTQLELMQKPLTTKGHRLEGQSTGQRQIIRLLAEDRFPRPGHPSDQVGMDAHDSTGAGETDFKHFISSLFRAKVDKNSFERRDFDVGV